MQVHSQRDLGVGLTSQSGSAGPDCTAQLFPQGVGRVTGAEGVRAGDLTLCRLAAVTSKTCF